MQSVVYKGVLCGRLSEDPDTPDITPGWLNRDGK